MQKNILPFKGMGGSVFILSTPANQYLQVMIYGDKNVLKARLEKGYFELQFQL